MKIWLLIATSLLLVACSSSSNDPGSTGLSKQYSPEMSVNPGANYPTAMADSMYEPSKPLTPTPAPQGDFNTEDYSKITDNPFHYSLDTPVSTFSIDVDTASYTNTRRFLENGSLPPPDAVRIEEMVNYFSYNYPEPDGTDPVGATAALSPAPWNPDHLLLRLAVKAKTVATSELPPANLVFLLDTSGSMEDDNKLPLLKRSLEILTAGLRAQDRVAIVAYAGSAGVILESTQGNQKEKIIQAFGRLESGGSTAGGEGIELAYKIAKENYLPQGNNRVILCTDGDFNVGPSSDGDLQRMVEARRKDRIYLTALGFGMGNYKDNKLELLADKGNGNYAYIDNILEAKKVLGKELWGNIYTVARDVKIQVEFNPSQVSEYRLLGYENRLLAREDFNDDTKDAGEMGSGQTVTAFYELVPIGKASGSTPPVTPLAFQSTTLVPSNDLLVFRLRYKGSGESGDDSKLITHKWKREELEKPWDTQDADFRFAASTAAFGMVLRKSEFKGSSTLESVLTWAKKSKGLDEEGYRAEMIRLIEQAQLVK